MDTVGLVLDLVADTLSVYRNERRLGVLWTGVAGKQLSWFASVNVGSSVRVSKGIPPPGWYGLGVLAKVRMATACNSGVRDDRGALWMPQHWPTGEEQVGMMAVSTHAIRSCLGCMHKTLRRLIVLLGLF